MQWCGWGKQRTRSSMEYVRAHYTSFDREGFSVTNSPNTLSPSAAKHAATPEYTPARMHACTRPQMLNLTPHSPTFHKRKHLFARLAEAEDRNTLQQPKPAFNITPPFFLLATALLLPRQYNDPPGRPPRATHLEPWLQTQRVPVLPRRQVQAWAQIRRSPSGSHWTGVARRQHPQRARSAAQAARAAPARGRAWLLRVGAGRSGEQWHAAAAAGAAVTVGRRVGQEGGGISGERGWQRSSARARTGPARQRCHAFNACLTLPLLHEAGT